jgi:hypothetical protein
MLTTVPDRPFTWNCAVYSDRHRLSSLSFSCWGEAGMFEIWGERYRIYPEADGTFVLEQNKRAIAIAEKPNPFYRMFFIQHGESWYELKAERAKGRRFVLQKDGELLGWITPQHPFTRKTNVQIPDTIPLCVRLFMVWLVMMLWRRTAEPQVAERAIAPMSS